MSLEQKQDWITYLEHYTEDLNAELRLANHKIRTLEKEKAELEKQVVSVRKQISKVRVENRKLRGLDASISYDDADAPHNDEDYKRVRKMAQSLLSDKKRLLRLVEELQEENEQLKKERIFRNKVGVKE